MMNTTSPMVSSSSCCTPSMLARIVTVRSVSTWSDTAAGSDACSCGSSALMLSTTAMMFAPGCRWMLTITAGTSFIQAACRTFSAPSTTRATSASWIGAPLR